ncbi:hypothetical protein [Caballeronia sp. 15711]|uniref:hypothetical protein n=1 Tax=Caballeronia sp. 15711 TaxID=3391029 RepID=UPI0039E563BB
MYATIVSVSELEGVLAPNWEFDYTVGDRDGVTLYGTLSADEAIGLAGRANVGVVSDMCRAIQHAAPSEFSLLVGRIFQGAPVAPTPDHVAGR